MVLLQIDGIEDMYTCTQSGLISLPVPIESPVKHAWFTQMQSSEAASCI